MAQIAYLSGSQIGMKLIREQYMRRMSWGNEWQQLRIAVRFGYEAPNQSPQSLAIFVGVCSGGKEWNNPSCVIAGYFFGNILGGFPGFTTGNFNGGATPYYNTSSNGARAVTKVGSVLTLAGGTSEGVFWAILPLTQMIGALVDRSAQSSTVTSYGGYNNNSFNAYVSSEYDFLSNLDNQGMPSTFIARGGGSPAISDVTSPLDYIMVANFGSVPFAVFDIGVQRTL